VSPFVDRKITLEVHLFSVRTCYVGAVRKAGELKEQGQGSLLHSGMSFRDCCYARPDVSRDQLRRTKGCPKSEFSFPFARLAV
jgi:hypothetical protein